MKTIKSSQLKKYLREILDEMPDDIEISNYYFSFHTLSEKQIWISHHDDHLIRPDLWMCDKDHRNLKVFSSLEKVKEDLN